MGNNPKSINYKLSAIWHWLTEPADSIQDAAQRRKMRLLATVSLVTLSLFTAFDLANFAINPSYRPPLPAWAGYPLFITVYLLVRLNRYRLAAWLLSVIPTAVVSMIILTNAYGNPAINLNFFLVGLVLSNMLLTKRDTVIMAALNIAIILLLAQFSALATFSFEIILIPVAVNIIIVVLLVITTHYRNQEEQDRQAELHRSEQALRQARDELETRVVARTRDLQDSEARYRSLFEDSPISLWEEDFSAVRQYIDRVRATGVSDLRAYFEAHPEAVRHCVGLIKILNVNQATLKIYKAGGKEDFLTDGGLEPVYTEESHPVFREELIALANGETWLGGEFAGKTMAGDTLNVSLGLSMAPGYEESWEKVLVSVIDITDRVQTEEALRESEQKFRGFAERSFDVIFMLDVQGCFTYLSPACENVFGYTSEEMTGKHFTVFLPEHETPRILELLIRALKGEFIDIVETEIIRKDGNYGSVELSHSLIKERELVAGVQGVIRNVTERKQAENQIKASLEEKEALLKEIHHRVKNNLQVITSMLNMQTRYIQDEQAIGQLMESRNRVYSMALVHENLYRSETLAQVDIGAYISDLINNLLQFYGLELSWLELELDVAHIFLMIDQAVPCGLIINELVSNALKHAFPKTGGRARAGKGKITIAFHPGADGMLVLTVADNGVGLPADLDLNASKTLGLRLVRTLVRQLGATLEVDAASGVTVNVTFKRTGEHKNR
ncbi:MAG: PAS domain S-box protein [Anaerolineaceae bacterium]|nr:PAS domain S-box protein [Anaerolineaceae bacterium]MCB9100807.1 PAS domain S-box protein [Anaerolineales bacterium]